MLHRMNLLGLAFGFALAMGAFTYGTQHPTDDLPHIIVSHPD
jgi:hypothetical protein